MNFVFLTSANTDILLQILNEKIFTAYSVLRVCAYATNIHRSKCVYFKLSMYFLHTVCKVKAQ